MSRAKMFAATMTGLAVLTLTPAAASASEANTEDWNFCGSTSASWSTSTQGRSGTVTVSGECAIKANWRIDVYVNGEWWVYSTGKVNVGTHTIRTVAPSMPKPNDKRGNYTWAKITYTSGATWKNEWEEDLGYLPCKGCTS